MDIAKLQQQSNARMYATHFNMKILVIAAHPDDEVLGCGGTIAKHADNGDEVSVLIIAEGATSRQPTRDRSVSSSTLNELAKAAQKAAEILGVHSLELLQYPDNRLDSMDRLDLIKIVEDKVDTVAPDIVYVHYGGDLNIDHRRIHEAVLTACRPTPSNSVRTLLSFEVASSTEWSPTNMFPGFTPNWFVDISEQIERKRAALEAYAVEMRCWPHARSHEAVYYLNKLRGSQVGCSAAEAFVLVRHIS